MGCGSLFDNNKYSQLAYKEWFSDDDIKNDEVMVNLFSTIYIIVTGFAKTLHVCTRIEIHFIAYCNSHTRALSRHNNKTGIHKQVCFYRRPIIDPVKSRKTIIDPVRPLRGINRVAWSQIMSHCTSARLMIW